MSSTVPRTPQEGAFAHPVRNVEALGLQEGMSVADFGSGSGAYVLAMAEELKGTGRVYALDVQRDLLRRTHHEALARGFHNIDVLWADLERPGTSKVSDQTLDLVLISNLLFQIADKRALLAEAWRILKPSGRLALVDWADSFGGMGPVKADVVAKERALDLARASGFELSHEFDAGAHHYGCIFRLAPRTV